ncbi:MAG: hypothetical protein ACYC2T_00850 [Bacillota bacterium]
MENISVLIFLHIITSLLTTFTGLRILDYKGHSSRLVLIGVLQGIFLWLVRGFYILMHIPLGSHLLIILIAAVIFIKLIARVSWGMAFGSSLMSFIMILLGSALSVLVATGLSVNTSSILSSPWLHIAFGYLEASFLMVMLLANLIFGFKLTKATELD